MSKIITAISSEKGAGKTTAIAAVASSLAMLGHNTLCICFEADSNDLEHALCIDEPADIYLLDDPPDNEALIDATYEHIEIENLFYLNVQSKCEPEDLKPEDVSRFFDKVRKEFDFCIIDTRPELCAASKVAQIESDSTLVITTEDLTSLEDAKKLVNDARKNGIADIKILVNKIEPMNFITHWEQVDKVLDTIDAKLIGAVLDDANIARALKEHTPLILYRKKLAIYDFMDTARRYMGELIRWPFQRRQPVITAISIKGVSNIEKGSYGDPESWAKSTLIGDAGELIQAFEIKPAGDVSLETIRNRIWVHDLLDSEKIKYKIDIAGYWTAHKKYTLSQSIFVKTDDFSNVRELLQGKSSNVEDDDGEYDDLYESYEEKLLQKICPQCESEIDFDYYKCPVCKTILE